MEKTKNDNRKRLGSYGEELAIKFLESNGYSIKNTNYRCGKLGEIDIIAIEKEYICFIEVKTRTGTAFGTPGEAVSLKKQDKIRRLAMIYLKTYGLIDRPVRFDIVEVTGRSGMGTFFLEKINIIKNAF